MSNIDWSNYEAGREGDTAYQDGYEAGYQAALAAQEARDSDD